MFNGILPEQCPHIQRPDQRGICILTLDLNELIEELREGVRLKQQTREMMSPNTPPEVWADFMVKVEEHTRKFKRLARDYSERRHEVSAEEQQKITDLALQLQDAILTVLAEQWVRSKRQGRSETPEAPEDPKPGEPAS